jgi:hypothetical protein
VYQFRAIPSSTVPPYATMFAPCSANVRATSSSSRARSQASTAIWARKLAEVAFPSHSTGVKRSGLRISALTLGQSARWIVMPRPSEM